MFLQGRWSVLEHDLEVKTNDLNTLSLGKSQYLVPINTENNDLLISNLLQLF